MLSIIIPIYNEQENIAILAHVLKEALTNKYEFEVILVDDGSVDNSVEEIKKIVVTDKNFKLVSFRRNFGQTAAIAAGIDVARGDIIIPMDADLQNDPIDIPKLVGKIQEGFDVVSGWRKDRHDKFLNRRLPSMMANWLISRVTKVRLHDYGCTMKAYRKEVIKDVKLYGEMHRFIPAYASWFGAKITEVEVVHHARKFGKSKYNIMRTFRVILDLLTVKFLGEYFTKPIYFFGKIGFLSLFVSFVCGALAVYYKLAGMKDFISTPLPLLTALFLIVGVLFILMGLLAEIIVRTYYESQDKKSYIVKDKINID